MEKRTTMQFLCSYILWPFALLMGVHVEDCRKVAQLIGVKTFINEFVAFEELGVFISNRALFDTHVAKNGSWSWTGNRDDILLYNANGNDTILTNGIINVLFDAFFTTYIPVFLYLHHYEHYSLIMTCPRLLYIIITANIQHFIFYCLSPLLSQDRSVVISTYALCGFSNISSIGVQIGAFTAMVPARKRVFSQIAVRAMVAGSIACFITAVPCLYFIFCLQFLAFIINVSFL